MYEAPLPRAHRVEVQFATEKVQAPPVDGYRYQSRIEQELANIETAIAHQFRINREPARPIRAQDVEVVQITVQHYTVVGRRHKLGPQCISALEQLHRKPGTPAVRA